MSSCAEETSADVAPESFQSLSWRRLAASLVSSAAAISFRKLALACADFLRGQDATLRSLGWSGCRSRRGRATVAMTVPPSIVNGLGIAHGGAIFTPADSVFALACNAYNERMISAHCSIAFLRPTRLGDRLVTTGTEVVRSGRYGFYDVRVTVEDSVVAEFRAHSRVIGEALLPADRDNPANQGA
jgi:acyl-CoA thioesterase